MGPLRCSAFLAMSLDGMIARPDGRVDWLDP
jgi:riboflavin biosynthesis pyrimidine reductase